MHVFLKYYSTKLYFFMLFFTCKHMHTALYALFHHCARHLVGFVDIPRIVMVVRAATAAANKLCKATLAALAGEEAVSRKLPSYVGVELALVHVAH